MDKDHGHHAVSNVFWEREHIFKQNWDTIEDIMMKITSTLFRKYVNHLYDFIVRYSSKQKVILQNGTEIGFNYSLMPTAMIALSKLKLSLK